MGSSGFYHILMACNGLYQFIRGISWFYLVLPSFFFRRPSWPSFRCCQFLFLIRAVAFFVTFASFLSTTKKTNKQTNKPTNQPTNKQTNQKETASFCQLKAAERGVLAADQQIDRPRKKKKSKQNAKMCNFGLLFFFRFRSHRLRHFIGDMIRWAMDFSLRYLSLSLSHSSFFFFSFLFLFYFFIPRTVTRFDWIRSLESGSRLFFLLLVFIVATRIGSDRVLPSFT